MSKSDTRLFQELTQPAQSAWEPSQTIPLDYPTSTVKRGVTRFHEEVRTMAGGFAKGDTLSTRSCSPNMLGFASTRAASSLTPD